MIEPCHHQRDIADLNKQLQVLRKHVIHGDSSAVKSLLDKWSAHDAYVHNLNNLSAAKDQDYPQIQCSDLDYLARYQVSYAESNYGHFYQVNYANVADMTMLELALHMTKGANQRALTMALNNNSVDVGNQGERSEDRIRIIRLLLEKGFLWGSGDLVCKVVDPGKWISRRSPPGICKDHFARLGERFGSPEPKPYQPPPTILWSQWHGWCGVDLGVSPRCLHSSWGAEPQDGADESSPG